MPEDLKRIRVFAASFRETETPYHSVQYVPSVVVNASLCSGPQNDIAGTASYLNAHLRGTVTRTDSNSYCFTKLIFVFLVRGDCLPFGAGTT